MVKVTVSGLVLDDHSNQPIMLLQEEEGNKVLPIWIGPAEASAIAYTLNGMKTHRPMTFDLMKIIIDGMGGSIERVVVSELKENTFYATIVLKIGNKVVSIDARPSDSVALALRTKSPIYVAKNVMEIAGTLTKKDENERIEKLRSSLKNIDPESFGNCQI